MRKHASDSRSSASASAPRLRIRPVTLLAGLFALSGLVAAWWAIRPDLGLGRGVRVVGGMLPEGAIHHDTPLRAPAAAAGALPDYTFRELDNPEDARVALRDLADRVSARSLAVAGLATLSDEERAGYADRVSAVLEAFLIDDTDHFLSITEMFDRGEPLTEERKEEIIQSWRNGVEHFGLAPIAIEHAETTVFRDASGARQLQDDFTGIMRLGIKRPRMVTRVAGTIPWRDKARSYETRVPVLISDGEGGRRVALVGIILAQDPSSGQWRTVETRVMHEGSDAHRGMSEAELRRIAFNRPTWPPI